MAKLTWDTTGEKLYETGVKECVLYVYDSDTKEYGAGVAWNGITAINETPTGAEATDLFADDQKYISLLSAEELEGTIEAYMYPDEFMACDGSEEVATGIIAGQQSRKMFALAYTTTVGNDTEGNEYGEKLHIMYGCKASPSERAYSTINDSPEAITFSWSIKATKETVATEGVKPTALITIDKKKAGEAVYNAIKDSLHGTSSTEPTLLLPDDVFTAAKG